MQAVNDLDAVFARLQQATGARNDSELARALGITPQSVNGARKRGIVPPVWIQSFAEKTGVSCDWLFFGRGPFRVGEPVCDAPLPAAQAAALRRTELAQRLLAARGQAVTAVSAALPDAVPCCDVGADHIVTLPVCDACMPPEGGRLPLAGAQAEAEGGDAYSFRRDFLQRRGCVEEMVLLRVAGDSMWPHVRDGDVVLVDQSARTLLPGKLYAVNVDGAVYVKLLDMVPGKLVLRCCDQSCPQIEVATDEVARGVCILGRIVWLGRTID